MKEILFATSNKAKIRQLQFIIDYLKYDLKIVSVYEKFPHIQKYSEEYTTQEEIVENGAREIYEQINLPIVVEDTMTCVETLNNRPGITSADYLKEKGRAGLLEELKGKENRAASKISVIGYYDGKVFKLWKTKVEGSIALEEYLEIQEPEFDWLGVTAENYYGGAFAPIFIPKGETKTLTELGPERNLELGDREQNFISFLKAIVY